MTELSHDGIVESLARHLWSAGSRIVWKGVGIGSRWLQNGNIPVPDVFTMQISYTRPDLTAYEVKASRGDFRSDTTAGKYRRYLDHCHRLFFAAPSGLLTRAEIPAEAGLITFNPAKGSWSVSKAAPRRECELEDWEWQSLLFARYEQGEESRRLADRIREEENLPLSLRARDLGRDVARALEEADALKELTPGARHAVEWMQDLMDREGMDESEVRKVMAVAVRLRKHMGEAERAAAVLDALFDTWGGAFGRAIAEFGKVDDNAGQR